MATASSACALGEDDPATTAAAWRLLETGDTLSISQVESVGMRMLLRRARELAELQSQGGRALGSIEHPAQLLSLWKPGAYNKEHEQAHFDARFAARERPSYPDPSMAAVRSHVRPGPVGRPAVILSGSARLSSSQRRGRVHKEAFASVCLGRPQVRARL
jgi:hypothetical protein